jgi:hypothetical protein
MFEFPIFTPAMGVRVIFEILFTLRQSRLGFRIFLSSTYPFAPQFLFILSFFLSIGGGGGFKGVKRLKRATTLKCSSGHIQPRKN